MGLESWATFFLDSFSLTKDQRRAGRNEILNGGKLIILLLYVTGPVMMTRGSFAYIKQAGTNK